MNWKHLISILCIALLAGAIYIALMHDRQQFVMPVVVPDTIVDEPEIVDESSTPSAASETKDHSETYKALEKLHEKYKDVYAWIEIPGTKIDYPILQHGTDDEFYLHHDMTGDESLYGAIYTEAINNKNFKDPNTVIYGHNMQDESMFGTLKWFEEADFFNQYTDVVITTLEDIRRYKIIAAYRYSDDHLLKNQDMFTREGIREYLQKIPEYVMDADGFLRDDIDKKEPIITLSSCASGDNTYRFLVQAVLVGVEKV